MSLYKPNTKEELKKLVQGESINLGYIDTSLINDMSGLFEESKRKNFEGIETWELSNVINMSYMFYGAKSFNQDISSWDVSNVRYARDMFYNSGMKQLPSWYRRGL